jgi:hypothetical protein
MSERRDQVLQLSAQLARAGSVDYELWAELHDLLLLACPELLERYCAVVPDATIASIDARIQAFSGDVFRHFWLFAVTKIVTEKCP